MAWCRRSSRNTRTTVRPWPGRPAWCWAGMSATSPTARGGPPGTSGRYDGCRRSAGARAVEVVDQLEQGVARLADDDLRNAGEPEAMPEAQGGDIEGID